MAARRGADDRALPPRREARARQAAQGAARPRARRARGGAVARAAAAGSSGSAAPCATSRSPRSSPPGLPTFGVQGFVLTKDALDALVDKLAELRAGRPGEGAGHQGGARRPDPRRRRDDPGGARGRAASRASRSPRRACARASSSSATSLPTGLFDDVRRASVENLHAQFDGDDPHVQHVARLALEMFDGLAACGLHDGDAAERELLWAAAQLHDIGVHVDYDDHHKHSRYLILNAGLPGWTQREIALIAQMARYHRKGSPGLDDLGELGVKGDRDLVARCSAILRLAEHLERSRDQLVATVHGRRARRHGRAAPGGRGRRVARALGGPARARALRAHVLARARGGLARRSARGRRRRRAPRARRPARSATASTISSSATSSSFSWCWPSHSTRKFPVTPLSPWIVMPGRMVSPSSKPRRSMSKWARPIP